MDARHHRAEKQPHPEEHDKVDMRNCGLTKIGKGWWDVIEILPDGSRVQILKHIRTAEANRLEKEFNLKDIPISPKSEQPTVTPSPDPQSSNQHSQQFQAAEQLFEKTVLNISNKVVQCDSEGVPFVRFIAPWPKGTYINITCEKVLSTAVNILSS